MLIIIYLFLFHPVRTVELSIARLSELSCIIDRINTEESIAGLSKTIVDVSFIFDCFLRSLLTLFLFVSRSNDAAVVILDLQRTQRKYKTRTWG